MSEANTRQYPPVMDQIAYARHCLAIFAGGTPDHSRGVYEQVHLAQAIRTVCDVLEQLNYAMAELCDVVEGPLELPELPELEEN